MASRPVIIVRVSRTAAADPQEFRFDRSFRIGRSADADVSVQDEHVSRSHAAVELTDGTWTVRDLDSSNGLFLGKERVQCLDLSGTVTVFLGISGPAITFEVEANDAQAGNPGEETQWLRRYLDESRADTPGGEHTMMVRRALKRVERKHHWRYGVVIALLALLIAAAAVYAIHLRTQLSTTTQLAQDVFYAIKLVDLDIARAEQNSNNPDDAGSRERISNYEKKREEMQRSYDRFLTSLNLYDAKLTPTNRLIFRIARIFGESELTMPAGFIDEVSRYIDKWRSTGRFRRAVATAQTNGYTQAIARFLLKRDLPPQFFYLAMQESEFNVYASGPPTRKGIAKGMWQFIPETGVKYGLRIGPLADLQRADPADERQHFDAATDAATRYIKDLYSTDAQASGLLVMACYNWGDDRVLPLVRSMPANPRDRNFWKLLEKYRDRIPQETYDYVFYIVSAAVIGEDPRLFGFDFDGPLSSIAAR